VTGAVGHDHVELQPIARLVQPVALLDVDGAGAGHQRRGAG
jgi:hypothetical protein